MYGDYTTYVQFYGDGGLKEVDYRRLAIKADRLMDAYTTTIDGVKKLKSHYPTDPGDAEIVALCHCEIVNALWQIQTAEDAAQSVRGYEVTENGLRGKSISSMSAGNESISYGSATGSNSTAVDKAVADLTEQKKMILDIIRTYLSGIEDSNGVNLMYGGRYPVCTETT